METQPPILEVLVPDESKNLGCAELKKALKIYRREPKINKSNMLHPEEKATTCTRDEELITDVTVFLLVPSNFFYVIS